MSSDEQASSGAGLEAQRRAIAAECRRRGWDLVDVLADAGYCAKDVRRPGVAAAVEMLERGDADGLVVAKLDRLSRSMPDFAVVMAKVQKEGWALVAFDCAVDSTSPGGDAMAHVLATFAQFERRLISQRTRDALAAKRQQGVRLGRPSALSSEVVERIADARRRGESLAAIAATLNAEGVGTAQGGRQWWPSTVRSVLMSTGEVGQAAARERGGIVREYRSKPDRK